MAVRATAIALAASLAPWQPAQAQPPAPDPALPGPADRAIRIPAFAAPPANLPRVIEWVGQSYPVVLDAPARQVPRGDAAVIGHLMAGTRAEVAGLPEEDGWILVRLDEARVAFVQAAAIPAALAAPPEAADVAAPAPRRVSGVAMVHDTATLIVQDQASGEVHAITLAGLAGFGGEPAIGMQAYIEGAGGWVDCEPVGSAGHVCRLPDATNLAEAALVNGAAQTLEAAPPAYRIQQANAQAHRRGIWRGEALAVPPPPGPGEAAPGISFVPGVTYAAAPAQVPPVFRAASPVHGLAFIDEQPFTLVEGEIAPVVFIPAVGWGFWDRSFVWRPAPPFWIERLQIYRPAGIGLRPVPLEAKGHPPPRAYFRGPAVGAGQGPGAEATPLERGPYAPPALTPRPPPMMTALRPAAGALAAAGVGFVPAAGHVRFATAVPRLAEGRASGGPISPVAMTALARSGAPPAGAGTSVPPAMAPRLPGAGGPPGASAWRVAIPGGSGGLPAGPSPVPPGAGPPSLPPSRPAPASLMPPGPAGSGTVVPPGTPRPGPAGASPGRATAAVGNQPVVAPTGRAPTASPNGRAPAGTPGQPGASPTRRPPAASVAGPAAPPPASRAPAMVPSRPAALSPSHQGAPQAGRVAPAPAPPRPAAPPPMIRQAAPPGAGFPVPRGP